ncbi:MAG: hypothetical protein Q8P01_01275 [bacterium]|nr:hypothetical protein [bacterium]
MHIIKKTIVILIVITLIGIGVYLWTNQGDNQIPSPTPGQDESSNAPTRIEVLDTLVDNWTNIQKEVSGTPVLGSTKWSVPNDAQFISANRVFIGFDDGHVTLGAIFEYDNALNFTYVAETRDYPFGSETKWKEFIAQYSDTNYQVETYAKSIFRGGEMIFFDEWTKVPENRFVFGSS